MAHQSNIAVGGHTVPVWEFDSTAQQIDDVVAVLGAASTPQEALAALGAAVRPNLLDNAYFVGGGTGWGSFPVNQRGQAEYSGVAPLFDRWKNSFGNGGSITLTQNGVTFTGANPYLAIRQVLKRVLPIGETYSLSILLHDKSFYTRVITVPTKNEYSQPVLIGNSMLRLFGPDLFELIVFNGDTIPEVVLIKLEPGKTQTAAYQKADGTWAMLPQNLDYHTELAKCQAYLKPLAGFYVGGTAANSTTKVSFFVPGPMRALPVVSGVTNLGDAYIAGAEIPDGIVYFGNGSFNVIQRGNGYIVQVEQPKSIGSLKNGRIAFDVGWLNAEL